VVTRERFTYYQLEGAAMRAKRRKQSELDRKPTLFEAVEASRINVRLHPDRSLFIALTLPRKKAMARAALLQVLAGLPGKPVRV
jgi:hypothetical protein